MSDELTSKQVIEGIESAITDWEFDGDYRGYWDEMAQQTMIDDLRTLLEIAKTALEPNTTIDLIRDPDGAIERLTVAANSVRIETYGDVRFTPFSDPPPYGHGTVRITTHLTTKMQVSGDIAVVTDQPYTWEHIKPKEAQRPRGRC